VAQADRLSAARSVSFILWLDEHRTAKLSTATIPSTTCTICEASPLMLYAFTRNITVCLLLLTAIASAQNVLRVYITTSAGINVYNAASNGKLALVSGSPFKGTSGLAIGAAGSHFITVGTSYIHSYSLTAAGGIGIQVSQINSALYTGSDCGTTAGGIIDHTGQEIYVQMAGGPTWCNALQSYKADSKTGLLTFNGATNISLDDRGHPASWLTLAPNNAHAYYIAGEYMSCGGTISGFYRNSYGTLYSAPFNMNGPSFPGLEGVGGVFYPSASANIAADGIGQIAMALFQDVEPPCNAAVGPFQLASFTVDYYGNLISTNKGTSMPVPNVYPTVLSISPVSNLLALGSNGAGRWFGTNPTTGLQIFYFNGANAITKYSATLTTAPIDALGWDKSNHLFAISKSTGKLYVYTVTPTGQNAGNITPSGQWVDLCGISPNSFITSRHLCSSLLHKCRGTLSRANCTTQYRTSEFADVIP
jgi:hypothetical protein